MGVHWVAADLPADDLASSAAFFEGVLGMREESLGLDWVTRFVGEDGERVQVVVADATATVRPDLSVKVDDVEQAYDAARAAGLEILHPLTTEPWGVRRFFVRAPGGAVVNVQQWEGHA